jgi:hypothetical protein
VRRGIESIWDWLTAREEFNGNDGQHHAIYTEGATDTAHIMVASTPMGIQAAINQIPTTNPLRAEADAEHVGLSDKLTNLKTLGVSAQAAGNRPASTTSDPNTQRIRTLTTGMRTHMRRLAEIFNSTIFQGSTTWPQTEIPAIPNAKAGTVTGKISPARSSGTPPGETPPGWGLIEATGLSAGAEWVRLHLINDRFAGPGNTKGNLVPGTRRNNSNHLATVENPIKRLVGEQPNQSGMRGTVWYRASVTYHTSVPAGTWTDAVKDLPVSSGQKLRDRVNDFAQSVHFSWGLYQLRAGTTGPAIQQWTNWDQGQPMGDFALEIPLPPFQYTQRSAIASAAL